MTVTGSILIIGAHGVLGRATAEHFAASADWATTTVSRRPAPELPDENAHISVDLLDQDATRAAFAAAAGITHVVYGAFADKPMGEATAPNLAMLANTLDGLAAVSAPLQQVVLLGGGKSYGEHLGPYRTPARETDPRVLGPVFYNEQEDLLAHDAERAGYAWTVLRPDIAVGLSVGSSMNLLHCIAVYATLCRDAGVPLRFPGRPGTWTALHQFTDADLLARATEWAMTSSAARGRVFNVINGDLFRWQHLWPLIAEFFQMPVGDPIPMSLVEQMNDKQPQWDRIVKEQDLRPVPFAQIASWPFADGVFGSDYDLVQSTIAIRQAGFSDCEDSYESFLRGLRRLREERYVP